MNKIANYKELIYKEASAVAGDIVPGDYSRVKYIELDSDEFRTIASRNLKMHEKAKEGIGNAAKKAKGAAKNVKQVAENIKGATPLQKALLGGIAAGTTLGAAGLAYEGKQLLKNPDKQKDTKADKSRDKDMSSRIMRDGVKPELKRDAAILPSKMLLNMAMVKPTMKLTTEGARRGTMLAHKLSKGNPNAALAGSFIGTVAGAGLASLPVAAHDVLLVSHQEIKEMDRLKKRYFNKGITEKEKKDIIKANIKEKITPHGKKHEVKPDTIEEIIQRRRRDKKRREAKEKKASLYLDEMYKEASEKWTKKDKKGYVKNVAINVAQDFMNAGNPLNVGSSIVGSIADAAILERSSLNLNKKLKADKVSQKQVDGFNKAVAVKSGTAIPHAAMKRMQK